MRLDDHGTIDGDPADVHGGTFTQELSWIGHDGSPSSASSVRSAGPSRRGGLAAELRRPSCAPSQDRVRVPGQQGSARRRLRRVLLAVPGLRDVDVFTADARGEDEVQGRVTPWVAWSADFAAGPGLGGPATIVLATPEEPPRGSRGSSGSAATPASGRRSPGTVRSCFRAGGSPAPPIRRRVADGRLIARVGRDGGRADNSRIAGFPDGRHSAAGFDGSALSADGADPSNPSS